MRKIRPVFAALLAVFTVIACIRPGAALRAEEPVGGTCGEDMAWEISGDTLAISGTGEMKEYGISAPWRPYASVVKKLVLTDGIGSVSAYAFYKMNGITSVTIPASCRSVGSFAFQDCTGLTAADINCGILGESAFIRCTALKTVTIGANVKAMGISAFESCNALSRVNIKDLKAYCSVYFGGLFASPVHKAQHIWLNNKEITSLTVPSGLKAIPDYAFINAKSITSATLPAGITSIGDYAFYGCSALSSVSLPSGLKTIGAGCFNGDISLKNITIPSSVSRIGRYAFYGVPVPQVTVTQGVIGKAAFGSCGATASVTLGGGIMYIGDGAFRGIPSICNVAYTGSRAQYKYMTIGSENDSVTDKITSWPGSGTVTVTTDSSAADVLCKGDTVTLGTYVQSGSSATPLKWTVLDVQEDKALVISEKILEFNRKMYSTVALNGYDLSWETSDMRTYLNDTFLNTAFTEEEQERITVSTLTNEENSRYGTPGGNDTEDRVFLLSEAEAKKYFAGDEERTASATDKATEGQAGRGVNPTSGSAYWWLRTPGVFPYSFQYVSYEGSLRADGAACANSIFGVRPAMWVNTDGLAFTPKRSITDNVKAFVQRLYTRCFGRNADKGGLNDWVNKLLNEQCTGAAVVSGFFNSREMQNKALSHEDFVETCYQVMMNRASDAGGKKGWVESLYGGLSAQYVLHGFVGSKEFAAICRLYGITQGTITLTQARDQNKGITMFVARCYTEALGRSFDENGLNTWCQKILDSPSRKQTAIHVAGSGFFHSREFRNKNTSDEEYVQILYRTFLGREADEGGFSGWVTKLGSGVSRDEVMNGFANSAEFAAIMARYGIR